MNFTMLNRRTTGERAHRRHPGRVASAMLVSAAAARALLGIATSASARTTQQVVPQQTVGASGSSTNLPNPGDHIDFRTWAWGATKINVYNYGGGAGQAKIQAWVTGADPEYIDVAPGESRSIKRWWFGNLVNVSNSGSSPLTVSSS